MRETANGSDVQQLPPSGAVLLGLRRRAERLEQEHRLLARDVGDLRAQLEQVQSALGTLRRPPAAAVPRELSGTLDGVGVGPLVRFLTELNAGGTLTIEHGPSTGVVFFEAGRVIGATFGQQRGWAALEAIALLLGHGRFVFSDASPERELNLILEPEDLQRRLDHLTEEAVRLAALVPSLAAVPRLADQDMPTDGPIWIDRSAVRLLRRVDGRQTVADLSRPGGLVPTVRQLARLAELDLIRLGAPRARAAAPPLRPLAARPSKPEHRSRPVGVALALMREVAQVLVLSAAVFAATRPFVHTFRVDGLSMAPSLQDGQMLMINEAAYWRVDGTPLGGVLAHARQGSLAFPFGGPQRGDVAVFRVGDDLAAELDQPDLIKRIIGLPGDTVLVEQGVVIVNGSRLDEPYVSIPTEDSYPGDRQPTRVPDDSYFVLGDNRPGSADSRLGWFVPAGRLVGRAWFSYWPPARWGLVAPESR